MQPDLMFPQRRHRFGNNLPVWTVNTWLIAICVALFVVDRVSSRLLPMQIYQTPQGLVAVPQTPVTDAMCVTATTVISEHQYWRFITFQFLHGNLAHLGFNMFVLYVFGPLIEQYLGGRRYLAFYLISGCAGALCFLLLYKCGILVTGANTPLVGASAGIFGVLLGAARAAPNTQVLLIFPPIPMKLRTLVAALLLIALLTVFSREIWGFALSQGWIAVDTYRHYTDPSRNAGGEAAHLGGAIMGYVLIGNAWLLNVFGFGKPRPTFAS